MYETEIDKLMNVEISNHNRKYISHIEHYNSIIKNILHMSANACIPFGKYRPYFKPYQNSNRLGTHYFEQRKARRANDKPRI